LPLLQRDLLTGCGAHAFVLFHPLCVRAEPAAAGAVGTSYVHNAAIRGGSVGESFFVAALRRLHAASVAAPRQ
jgi:hypothetical protein